MTSNGFQSQTSAMESIILELNSTTKSGAFLAYLKSLPDSSDFWANSDVSINYAKVVSYSSTSNDSSSSSGFEWSTDMIIAIILVSILALFLLIVLPIQIKYYYQNKRAKIHPSDEFSLSPRTKFRNIKVKENTKYSPG